MLELAAIVVTFFLIQITIYLWRILGDIVKLREGSPRHPHRSDQQVTT